ncbi:PREDICTED: homocysteine S-methyltransferase-like [Dinoponera quadriceps]|uniref:Homocysteine S-methyltransferase-like n=1 Tax=Dinoponera quadriceps TaxID=609295 RepID=A0A6P3WXW1_DINQU|nr:PREDICTED: homocysteine S-methyltransferase-like [Dinoponera quadriceps]
MDRPMILDGDFGAELRHHFQQAQKFGKAFTLHALQADLFAVYKTHLAYLRAGAQIIRTNTYQASIGALKKHLDLDPSESLLKIHDAVRMAKQAVTTYDEEMGRDPSSEEYQLGRPLVAGSCGSYMVSTLDDISDKSNVSTDVTGQLSSYYLFSFHELRVQALLEAGVDLLAFESIPSLFEVTTITRVLKKYPNARAWITLYCLADTKLMDGNEFEKVATYCHDSLPNQIIAVGAECASPETIVSVMRSLNDRRYSKIVFLLCAHQRYLHTKVGSGKSNTALSHNYVQQWWDAGIRFIGGGTDTVAKDIKKVCKKVEGFNVANDRFFTSLMSLLYQNKENLSKM